jgi:signal transduction histidine kinase
MDRAYSLIDWFIPPSLRYEKSDFSLARNFVFTHLLGPLMSQTIIVFLHRTDTMGNNWPAWVITVCVWAFWAMPFVLRYSGNLAASAFISVELLAFVSLFGAFHYGGATSPFLPWLIVSLLLGFFYLSRQSKIVVSMFAVNFAVFCAAYLAFGFSDRVSSADLEIVGWFSILSASIYMAWMAFYYTSILTTREALVRETEQLAATTERLREAKKEAERANEQRSIFLAKMSHELRTPLNAVIGYSEMIMETAQMSGSEARSRDVERINAAGRHLLSLVNDVLDIARIERDEIAISAVAFDIQEFAAEIVGSTDQIIGNKGNKLVLDCAAKLGVANTDPTKLRQVILNLLSNAAKFTTNGVVTLSVRRDNSKVGDWLEIRVRDTGIGITEADLSKLFRNFIQASASTSSRFGGTGLGLAHSQKLCGLLGGRISAESEVGKGSVFTIRIPTNLNSVEKRATASQDQTSTTIAA